MADDFYLRFWGVRGSCACPGVDTLVYGGNTSCVEVRAGGHLIILDAGTGLTPLGASLRALGEPVQADLLLSHIHYDHILGLPFFPPAYDPGSRLRFWAGDCDGGIEAAMLRFVQPPYFPVPLQRMSATFSFHDFAAGDSWPLSDRIRVRTAPLVHPDGATGYRIDYDGRSICYITDTEHPAQGCDENIVALVQDANIVIYDATFNDDDYPNHLGWGHSTWEAGLALCERAGAETLVVFHHAPERTDAELRALDRVVHQRRPGSVVAREGMVLIP
ncbi:MBL fold metallo-hydrolase [Marinobacterium nitratireducens]|uniref:MBL fold metallo-hydrolase n=1 Tax=Marinobacterium nitratireducens TaxID=518897 RepID=A0A917ZIP9_9GAMM|nr:MBL fold metallo-hydrolase [Marinobacterium nitratireducens]GGO83513.1 MBL fold metallo-hydrolase [Marinobacterium nitratireducens]